MTSDGQPPGADRLGAALLRLRAVFHRRLAECRGLAAAPAEIEQVLKLHSDREMQRWLERRTMAGEATRPVPAGATQWWRWRG